MELMGYGVKGLRSNGVKGVMELMGYGVNGLWSYGVKELWS